jgi:hypothetical protein
MSDRLYFSLMGLAAAAMIALALVWPQGMGARSPGPFGHEVVRPVERPEPEISPSLLPIPTAPPAPTLPDTPPETTPAPAESQ